MTMIVPTSPGGAPDILGRLTAARLTELLGQQVVVENIGGAGGMIGAARVARAPADGYQFLIGTVGTQAQNQTLHKVPLYNSATDFTPVALLWEVQFVLVVRNDLPADDLQSFLAYARANGTAMHYGSGGAGSAAHLTCALFNAAAGLNVTHVPYRGITPAMQDLAAGRIDYLCPSVTAAIGAIESRQMKGIALLSKDRSLLIPTLATAHEQGLVNFTATGWSGLFLPKAAPAPIVKKLNAAVVAALDAPAIQTRFREAGALVIAPQRRSPEYLDGFVKSEIAKWAVAIKAAGLAQQ